MCGVATIENWGLQVFAGFQLVAKVEGVETAGYAHGIELVLLNGDAPGTGPGQRAEPDFAVLFIGDDRAGGFLAGVAGNRKPRIGLMASGSAAAFDDALTAVNRFLIQGPFAGPAPGQVAQGVAR